MDLASRLRDLAIGGDVREDVPLAGLTTFEIGGPAEVLVEPASVRDAARVLEEVARIGAPVTILGGGSNVLAPDEGLEGVVLRLGERMAGLTVEDGIVTVQAGARDRDLAMAAARASITGFEFLEDIPGTVGGGLVQNAEAWGDCISDHLIEVTVLDLRGRIRRMERAELFFGYRDSTFKREGDLLVVEARFRPEGRDDPGSIVRRMDELRDKRHARYPLDRPNCGSVFKRPEGDFAGRLIEEAGLGGLSVGGARVSLRHHNFIVNTSGATAEDVRALVEMVTSRVEERSGVKLERELVYLGRD